MAFAVGDAVGLYEITGQIGQGGMATVYQAYHANLDRYVALKVLHPAFKEDPTFLERFKREARIVARLEHPHIVPVYDFADHEGQPYLIMKFIEGETLKARLKREPPTLKETLTILDAVARALTYAHEQGILHRDIKPSNIMLDWQGTPYLTDFGLARMAQAGESTMSQDMMLGTPQYISPEQAKGIYALGPGTDIYSLGVVIYEMVVGRVPFNADTPYAIVHDHIYKPLPLPSKVNPAVPLEVERVLLKVLAKEPEARYDSAVEMIDAFRAAVAAAGLTELSAAQVRAPDPVASATAFTLPEAASPLPTPAPQIIPVPSPLPATAGSTASRRAYHRRANLWILGGLGALLLTCLGSLVIIVNAVSDPELRPWNIDARPRVEQTREADTIRPAGIVLPGPFNDFVAVAVEEAENLIESDPIGSDPTNFLTITMMQMQNGNPEQVLPTLSQAITLTEANSDQIVTVARRADNAGRVDRAVWLYLEALTHDTVTPEIRAEAGEYVYQQLQAQPADLRVILTQFVVQHPQRATAHTFDALALLSNGPVLPRERVLSSLNTALELDETLAETYLARGLYYRDIGQNEAARADWERAAAFDDVPAWVVREVERLLQDLP